jgi:hypothetical protein
VPSSTIPSDPAGSGCRSLTPAGYRISGTGLTVGAGLAGALRSKSLIGEGYVTLKFTDLSATQDAIVMEWDDHAEVRGVTIDMGNPKAPTGPHTNGRDGLRVVGEIGLLLMW